MAKKLLEEQDVRKFMKIAGIQRLSENFLSSIDEEKGEMDDESEGDEEAGEEEMEVDVSTPQDSGDGVEMEPELDVEEPVGGEKSHEEKVRLIQDLARELFGDPELEIEIESEESEGEMEEETPESGEEMMESVDEVVSEEAQLDESEDLDEAEELDEGAIKNGSAPSPTKIKGQDHKMKPAGHSNKNSAETKKMQESTEDLKNQIVEQVAKRVANRLRDLK